MIRVSAEEFDGYMNGTLKIRSKLQGMTEENPAYADLDKSWKWLEPFFIELGKRDKSYLIKAITSTDMLPRVQYTEDEVRSYVNDKWVKHLNEHLAKISAEEFDDFFTDVDATFRTNYLKTNFKKLRDLYSEAAQNNEVIIQTMAL